jgi:hypothetical protein
MPIDVQCGCGKTFQVPDTMAGKRGRCKACGAVLVVPDVADDDDSGYVPAAATPLIADDSDDTVAAAVIPDDPPINISLQPRTRSRASVRASTREPWFYGFLELWAGLALLAAALQAFAAVLAIVIAVMVAQDSTTTADAGATVSATTAGIAFAGCLGSLTLAALIRMLVDIGRSLRGINQSMNS